MERSVCVTIFLSVAGTVYVYMYEDLCICMMALSEWGPVHFGQCVCCNWECVSVYLCVWFSTGRY